MEQRIRGAKAVNKELAEEYGLNLIEHEEKLNKTAEKVAQLLFESGTTFNDVDTVFCLTKQNLRVLY